VRVYRAALDYLRTVPREAWLQPQSIKMPKEYIAEILRTGTRGITTNFFLDKPGHTEMNYRTSRVEQRYEPVAVLRRAGHPPLVEIRNTLFPGAEVEYMCRGIETKKVIVHHILDGEGQDMVKANPGNQVFLVCEPELNEQEEQAIFRRKITGE